MNLLSRIKLVKFALRDDYFARILFNLLILAITSSIVTITIVLVKARDIQLSNAQKTEILTDIGESYNETSQDYTSLERDELPATSSSLPQETISTQNYGVAMEKSETYRTDATKIENVLSAITNPTSTEQLLSTSTTSPEPLTMFKKDVVNQRRYPYYYSTEVSTPQVESLSSATAPQTAIEQTTGWSTLMYKWKTEAAVVSTPSGNIQNPLNYRTIEHVVDYNTESVSAATENVLETLLNLEEEAPIEIQIQIPISEEIPLITKEITFEEVPMNEKDIKFEEHHNIDELRRIEVHKTHDFEKNRHESDGEFNYFKYQPYDVNKKFYKQLPYLIANSHNHLKEMKGKRLARLSPISKTNKYIKNSKRDLYGSHLSDLNNYGTNRLDPKYPSETSAEKEEKLNKALEGFTHALNIFAQMDHYFSTRLKSTIKKLAKLCEEEGPIL